MNAAQSPLRFLSWLALAAVCSGAQAASPPPVFRSAQASALQPGHTEVQLNTAALMAMAPGDEAQLSLPQGRGHHTLVMERLETAPSGSVSWIGHLRDHGKNYRAILTHGPDASAGMFGRILTPDGEFLLQGVGATTTLLVDAAASGLRSRIGGHADARVPAIAADLLRQVQARRETAQVQTPAAAAAAPTPQATVDLMVLYTPGLLAQLGGTVAAVQTRLDNLVAIANQAYQDSEVAMRLRLVRIEPVTYSDSADIEATLDALTDGTAPFANVAALRDTYGADLVTLMRRYQGADECGIAWTNGYRQTPMANYARYGYSVVANGSSGGYYCSDYTLVHELGHNMGSVHDRVTENKAVGAGDGVYAYSFGYGVSNGFSTIMAYDSSFSNAGRVGRFSNPNLSTCNGMPCGVSESLGNSANNTLSLNNVRLAVANFRATKVQGQTLDVRTYVPAAGAAGGYVSFLRVINTGQVPVRVSAAIVDPDTGVATSPSTLIEELLVGAATTLTAAQVEAVVGAIPAAQRPRIRLSTSADGQIRSQSFLLQPGGVFNEVSGANTGTSVTVATYVPAVVAQSGYASYLRIINTGNAASEITVAKVNPADGVAGSARRLLASLPAGAARTLTATEVEAALGQAISANERPRLVVAASGTTLEVQSFMLQPGGFYSQVSSGRSGASVDVANHIPAAATAFAGFTRVINTSASLASSVSVALINANTGAVSTPRMLIANLAPGAAVTLTSAQVESALGQVVAASERPRLRIASNNGAVLDVQSFMLQPGGGYDEVSNTLSGSDVVVRTYVPQADAGSGYVSHLRIVNTGSAVASVSVALVDGATGLTGSYRTLTPNLAGGAAQNFSASQIESALGVSLPAGSRPRIAVRSNQVLEVQSFLSQPSGAFTEVSGGQ